MHNERIKLDYSGSKKVFILIGILLFVGVASTSAESIHMSIESKIEQAKKIWDIEKLGKLATSAATDSLRGYLYGEGDLLSIIAARELAYINSESSKDILIDLPSGNTNAAIEVLRTFANSNTKSDAISKILTLRDQENLSFQKNRIIDNEVVALFCRNGWQDDLPSKLDEYPETYYLALKEKIEGLDSTNKIESLINSLLDYKNVFEYEASILILTELHNQQIASRIIELLDDPSNIPTTQPPPYERAHTIFKILTIYCKSTADSSLVDVLENYSFSTNKYISETANEALNWIYSNTPYPFKYQRLMFMLNE